MNPEEQDKPVRDLIAKVYLPRDLCPSEPEAIEAMLDAAGGQPLTNEQVDRMLKKARGELPLGERRAEEEQEMPIPLIAGLAFATLFTMFVVLPTRIRKYHSAREEGDLRGETNGGQAAD